MRAIQPIQSISEIPFVERPPLEALNLVDERLGFDEDDTGFGWCRVHSLWLSSPAGRRRVDEALVLVLHSADDVEPADDDIELEFFVEEVAPDYSVTAPLSTFLEVWLPKILDGSEAAIVLALCNPGRALVRRPRAAGDAPIFFALGDVGSLRDDTDLGPELSLVSDEWRTV